VSGVWNREMKGSEEAVGGCGQNTIKEAGNPKFFFH
jgi:hypothetical protein